MKYKALAKSGDSKSWTDSFFASFLILNAIKSAPLAIKTGAPSEVGSYTSATEKCSGLVITTSAICFIEKPMEEEWNLVENN